MKKKGKVVKTFEDRKLYFYLCPRSSVLSRGGILGELVKCKSSKNSFQSKLPEKMDISSLLTGIQKPLSDMSGPLRIPQSIGFIRVCCWVPVSITRHVRSSLSLQCLSLFVVLIRPDNRATVTISKHI
jgi:hypothetical protein